MSKEKTEIQTKQSATGNLKKLADVFFAKEELIAIDEIQKAREIINNICKRVKQKLSKISAEPVDMTIPEITRVESRKSALILPSKGAQTRDPGKLAAGNFGRNNAKKFQSQEGLQRTGSASFGGRKPFTSSTKPFGDKKPFGQKSGQKPFGNRPLNKLGTAEIDIDLNALKNNDRNFGNKKKTHNESQERKQMSKKAQMRWTGEGLEDDDSERMGRRYKSKKKETVSNPITVTKIEKATITTENLTVKLLSEQIGVAVPEIVKKLFILGMMATINSTIDYETAELVSNEFGIKLEKKIEATAEEKFQISLESAIDDDPSLLVKRPPIVTVMGHVDHGKTSLLDAVRKTNVVSGEAGGITQSIGASTTKVNDRVITFIDTPGHAAFTAMRERGAQITDIAILVVAADDGIMPQTIEAIEDIRSANVPMVVAINKVDKPEANVDRVLKELADHGVLPEQWGGDTICVPISAKKEMNIDKLLEMVLLVADMQELKANPNRNAIGTVIESRLDKGKGPVASILVQNGTLKVGDTVVAGIAFGKIRAMMDENGKTVKKATPSMPVQILGLDAVPQSGDRLMVVDEKMRAEIIAERKNKIKQSKIKSQSAVSIDDFFNKVKEGNLKNLNILIKADVQGSAEALRSSLEALKNEEAKVVIVSSGVGNITESDVLLAEASSARIIGFNVKAEDKALTLAKQDKVDIHNYSIIYECIEDIEKALKSLMAPKFADRQIGLVEVRQLFKISSIGTIAGCMVLDGKVKRDAKVHVIRDGKQIAEAPIESLKIQKNEVKDVGKGFECGIKLKDFDEIKEYDQFEIYITEQVML